MTEIKDLPLRLQAFAYYQAYTSKELESMLKRHKAKKYFRIRKEKKPSWYSGRWKQTYTLVPK